MSWRSDPARQYDPHGGRNAFRNEESQEEGEQTTSRNIRAMRSFTESIDCDIPPIPELPASLDIDIQMKNSDTNDTIIEVMKKGQSSLDHTLGETQKYKMAVPGPGQTDQEAELHKSLLKDNDTDSVDSELEALDASVNAAGEAPPKPKRSSITRMPQDAEHAALRQQYSTNAVTRPRPTTPTQSCAIETAAFLDEQIPNREQETTEKIKVKIPGKRKKSDMSYSDFYENMANQMPTQNRKGSFSGRTTPLNDYEGDILEENPEYKSKAPPKPVVHRRTSMDWENFEEMKQAKMEAEAAAVEKKDSESEVEAFGRSTTETTGDAGFDDSFAPQPSTSKERHMDDVEPEPQFSEDMAEERAKARKISEKAMFGLASTEEEPPGLSKPDDTSQLEEVFDVAKPDESSSTGEKSEDAVSRPEETTSIVPETTEVQFTEDSRQNAEYDYSQYYDENGQPYDYSQYPGYNHETGQYEGTYTDENGQAVTYDGTSEYAGTQYPEGGYDPNYQYDEAYYNSEEYKKWYEENYGPYDPNAPHSSAEPLGPATDAPETSHDYYADQNYQYDQSGYAAGENVTNGGEGQTGYPEGGYDPNYQYDEAYYNSEEYKKWYEENYGAHGAEVLYEYSQYSAEGADHTQYANGETTEATYDQNDYAAVAQPQENGVHSTYDYSNEQSEYDQNAYDYNHPDNHNGEDYSNPGNEYTETTYDYSTPHTIEEPPSSEPPIASEPVHEESRSAPPPRPPVVSKPLFESAPVHDPYAWDASESVPPVAPPSPARPPPPAEKEEKEEEPEEHTTAPSRPAPPPARPPPAARPPPPRPVPPPTKKEEPPKPAEPEPEEDAWTVFKKMTEKVNVAVKSSEDTLKNLSETTAVNDIKDESYLAQVGGGQGYIPTMAHREIQKKMEEKKNEKLVKKKMKHQGKKAASPEFDPDQEDAMDKKAEELAKQLAAKLAMGNAAMGIVNNKEPSIANERKDSQPLDAIPPRKKSSIQEVHQESSSLDLPSHAPLTFQQSADSAQPIGDFHPDDPALTTPAWADFDSSVAELPPSESGFFSKEAVPIPTSSAASDPFAPPPKVDPFAVVEETNLMDNNYDPFDVRPVEDIVAAAKAKAEAAQLAAQTAEDLDFFGANERRSNLSTPTPEGGSPLSARPTGFEDDFKCEGVSSMSTPTPLYDEDDSQPLEDFIPKFAGEGWELMIRHPLKKKIMADRFWKPCFVRLQGTTLLVFNSKTDAKPIQELLLQATYSLSDTTLQAYDVYGKIHTVKLQYVQYKEKVGIRPGQISRLVDGHITKYGLPLEHSAQCNVLLKLGSLQVGELQSFVNTIEDVLFKCPAKRDTKPQYKQDEVQVHCYDEYSCYVDKDGMLHDQKARVRLFCLAFVSGTPFLEIGLNDRRRQGKEIVRRKDILPMYTERWIRFEDLEFHSTVDTKAFDDEQVIKLSPPDGCFFEVMRFRVRPPRNREKAITIKCIMKIAGSKVEIRLEAMAAAQVEKSRGGKSTRRQIPCEDITIRFPIPEAWIYIFREERHWGVGSVHSKKMRPGKVKNLKDRLLGAVQTSENNLIECAIGEAKYEHVYRSLVWRIPRLPEKHHAAYKAHLLRCRFELSSFDLMPETFLPTCEVDFTMPLATVSNTVVRSVSVEQHEDSDRVEKYVRYVAKCQYKVEIDYVQCTDLDVDAIMDPTADVETALSTVPELHKPAIHPNDVAQMHEGYRIDLPESQYGSNRPKDDSSSDEEEEKKFPTIQIDMSNYGY